MRLDITHTDLMTLHKIEMKNCPGHWVTPNILVYEEEDNTSVRITFTDDKWVMERLAENHTRMEWVFQGTGTATMETEVGEFQFTTHTEKIRRSNKLLSVQYTLYQMEQEVSRMHIRWLLKEEQA